MPSEKYEERKYARWVKARGGRCIKLNTVGPFGTTGEPDRLTLLGPPPTASFKEFKRKGGKVTPLQAKVHEHYRKMGIPVHVVHSAKEAIEIDERVFGIEHQAKAPPTRKHKVRVTTPSSRIFPRAGAGQNAHNSLHLQDTTKGRSGRPSTSDSIKAYNLRRLAAGG